MKKPGEQVVWNDVNGKVHSGTVLEVEMICYKVQVDGTEQVMRVSKKPNL